MKGRTPGKRMTGLRIISRDGHEASDGALLIRNLFRMLDSLPSSYVLGLIVAMSNKRHCRIGDFAAGTLLVYEEKAEQKDIAAIIGEQGNGIATQQRELVQELLERWKGLQPAVRGQLAEKLLNSLGENIDDIENNRKRDQVLRDRLKQLLE